MHRKSLLPLVGVFFGFASYAGASSVENYVCNWTQTGKGDISIQLDVVTHAVKIRVVNELPVTETSPSLMGMEISGIATLVTSPVYKRENYVLPGWSGEVTIWKDLSSGAVSLSGLDGYASTRQMCELNTGG